MGHAISYCAACNTQLRDPDFEKGTAFRAEGRVFCAKCAPEEIKSRPPEKKPDLSSTARIKMPAPSSRRMEAVPSENQGTKVVLFAAAGVVGIGLIALLAMSGGSSPRPAAEPVTPPVAHGTDPVPPPPPPPPPTRDDKPAENALRKARDFAQTRPEDLAGQLAMFETAVREAEGTGHHATASRERDAVLARQKTQAKVHLDVIDVSVRTAVEKEEFAAAVQLLDEAKRKPMGPDWSAEIAGRSKAVSDAAEKLYAAVRKDAVDASKRGAAEDVKKLVARVDKWGIHAYRTDLAKAVAGAVPKPPPKPVPPKEADVYRKQWTEAIGIAAGRDWAAALQKLEAAGAALTTAALKSEAAADVELFKAAMAAHEEGIQILSKTAKGQKVTLAYLNPAGTLIESAGTVARIDAGQIDLAQDKGTALIPVGEIAGRSVAQGLKGKRDGRDLALLCLAEGDVEGAKTFVEGAPTIPDKYWKLALPVIAAEAEARRLYYQADRESGFNATVVDAAQKFASLLKDRAETAFVRRNRALIAARTEAPREFHFGFEDFRINGAFKAVKGEKDDVYWNNIADGENFVDLSFGALADVEYRCWVYVGGCCTETVACTFQIVEGADAPGEPAAAKQLPSMQYKTHVAHEGRGRPVPRWGWASLPLPKFAAAGTKRLRIFSPLKGFCIAQAFVSATRPSAPSTAEIRELERSRGPRPDPSLVGHWKLNEGAGTTAFDSGPYGADGRLTAKGCSWVAGTATTPPALKLDGTGCVNLGPDLPMLQRVSGATLAAWICADKLSAEDSLICILNLSRHNGATPTPDSRVALGLYGGIVIGSARATDAPKAALGMKTTERPVKVGTWVHIATTIDLANNSIVLYANGVPQAAAGTTKFDAKMTPNTTCTVGAIGADDDGKARFFAGKMSDVRLYSRVLTKEEIAELAAPR